MSPVHASVAAIPVPLRIMPLLLVHLGAVIGLVMGAPPAVWALALALYCLRMFGVTAGYHRYFSHRAFKTGRVRQFLLACLAMSSSQKGVLWWASHHRHHHQHSDDAEDRHAPGQRGFGHAHVGWVFADAGVYRPERIRDLLRFPELRVLEQVWMLPPALLALACLLLAGLPGLLVGFCLSTVCCWHATFAINSLAHLWGTRRYATKDHSRNNALLALLTFGEGWHNN
ncbi:MAG: acyl-CoA desaturase, partial [Planctomycetota bacterium]